MADKMDDIELGSMKPPSTADSSKIPPSNDVNNVTMDPPKEHVSFAGVVRTTMIIKNWLLSVQQEDFDTKNADRMSEINTSLVFEPTGITHSRATSIGSSAVDLNALQAELEGGVNEMQLSPRPAPEAHPQAAAPREPSIMQFQTESKLTRVKNKITQIFKFILGMPTMPIDASQDFYYYWSFVIYVAFLYNAFMCVIFVFEETTDEFYPYWIGCNLFVDFIYVVDMVINAKLCYMDQGLIVKDWRLLYKNYFKSPYFKFDIACILPLDLLLIVWHTFCLVRVNRLIKFYKVYEYIQKQNIRTNFPNAFRIFHIFIICCTLFHWNSAAYFEISLDTGIDSTLFGAWEFNYAKIADPLFATCDIWQGDESENCYYQGQVEGPLNETRFADSMMRFWRPRSRTSYYSNFTKQYILSMYWSSLTLTTSGQQPYPTRSSHNLLEIFDTIIGMLIFAVIVGSVGNVVATMNKDKTDFQNLMDGLKFYMTYRDVQPLVQRRVKDVVAYIQKYGMINDEASIMEMYIVKRGTLEMLSETGKVVNRLKEGSSFGELAILKVSGGKNANRRNRSLRSVGYSDVYVLQREEALEVLQDYPEQRNKLIEKAKQMMRQQQQSEEIGEFNEDLHEFSGTKNTDETLASIAKSITTIDKEISTMQENFMAQSSTLKQRVTQLESTYYKNRRKIREVNAERLAEQLQI
uniref:Cyclic nucleotide-binding domain-containing protein n=1 Tax=Panagrellus redivivus TaxID=6233 RepID=A0A7E4UTX1_PANRE